MQEQKKIGPITPGQTNTQKTGLDKILQVPGGPAQKVMESSDVSYLLDKKNCGSDEEQVNAKLEIIKRIIEKNGDIETKRGLLLHLLEPFILHQGELVLNVFKTTDEKAVIGLIDAIPNKPTDAEVKSYNDLASDGRASAFSALFCATEKATPIAFKAGGVKQGIEDVLASFKTVNSGLAVFHAADNVVYSLLNPSGTLPKSITPQDLDSEIRSFLG